MSLIKHQRTEETPTQLAFGPLVPTGRAYLFASQWIKFLKDTICETIERCRLWLIDILNDRNPDLMREDALNQWERQYDISSNCAEAIAQRRLCVASARIPIGAQGPGYIQQRLQDVGFDVYVRENIPAVDLVTLGAVQFNNTQFSGEQFGSGIDGYLLGNGFFEDVDGIKYDPLIPPPATLAAPNPVMSTTGSFMSNLDDFQMGKNWSSWGFVFIIEGPDQTIAQLPVAARGRLERLVLRLKPAHLAVYMRVRYT